jgi:hypothetical protein
MSQRLQTIISVAIIAIYIILVFFFYEYTTQNLDIRFGADSQTYAAYAEKIRDDQLVSINGNYLGPILIFRLFSSNLFLVVVFNSILFIINYLILQKVFNLKSLKFTLIFLMNPLLFISLSTLNKEILGLTTISFLFYFLRSKNYLFLAISMLFAVLTRWQQVLVNLIFIVAIYIVSNNNKLFAKFATKNKITLIILFLISIIYPSVASLLSFDETETFINQIEKNGAVLEILNGLQKNYMFFLAFLPKAALNYLGNISRPFELLLNPDKIDKIDFFNSYIIPAHQVSILILIILFLPKIWRWISVQSSRQDMSANLFYCMIYTMLYSLGAFIQYRYFFPIYVLFCCTLAEKSTRRLKRTKVKAI